MEQKEVRRKGSRPTAVEEELWAKGQGWLEDNLCPLPNRHGEGCHSSHQAHILRCPQAAFPQPSQGSKARRWTEPLSGPSAKHQTWT